MYFMSTSEFQRALYKYYMTLKMCKHESDYTVLYDYMDMKHLMRMLLLSAQNIGVVAGTNYDQINLKKEFG